MNNNIVIINKNIEEIRTNNQLNIMDEVIDEKKDYRYNPELNITDITFEEGSSLREIYPFSFVNSKLNSIDLSKLHYLSSIGNCAFMNCVNLTNITIPATVTKISPYAFNGCSSLKTITFLSGIVKMEDNAFTNLFPPNIDNKNNTNIDIYFRGYIPKYELTTFNQPNIVFHMNDVAVFIRF